MHLRSAPSCCWCCCSRFSSRKRILSLSVFLCLCLSVGLFPSFAECTIPSSSPLMAQLSIDRRESRTTASGVAPISSPTTTNKQTRCLHQLGREGENSAQELERLCFSSSSSSSCFFCCYNAQISPECKTKKTHNKTKKNTQQASVPKTQPMLPRRRREMATNPKSSSTSKQRQKPPQKQRSPHTHRHTKLHYPFPPLAPKIREKKNSHKNTNQIKMKESKKTATTAAAAESAQRNAGKDGKESGKQTQKKEGQAPYQQLPVKTVKEA